MFVICKKICDMYGKNLMDTAIKILIDAAKATSKIWFGNLTGNEIADKITSLGKTKSKEKEKKDKKSTYHQKKVSKLLMT